MNIYFSLEIFISILHEHFIKEIHLFAILALKFRKNFQGEIFYRGGRFLSNEEDFAQIRELRQL